MFICLHESILIHAHTNLYIAYARVSKHIIEPQLSYKNCFNLSSITWVKYEANSLLKEYSIRVKNTQCSDHIAI